MSLFLYADDSCVVFQHKDINEIENQLNVDISKVCDWFVDNKLSIHFGEDKTESILFASKFKKKNIKKLHIKYGDIQIKQLSKVNYLGCLMDETMSGGSYGTYVIHKNNNKLKFLYCKTFLTSKLVCLFCNALMQPLFDYACSAWYPNLTRKLKNRIKTTQNKCMHFWLQLDKLKHISHEEFIHLNWLHGTYRFRQLILMCQLNGFLVFQ